MQTIQTDLIITGAHTPKPEVFWKGTPIPITNIRVVNNVVTLTLPEDPLVAEMVANGIKIVRV